MVKSSLKEIAYGNIVRRIGKAFFILLAVWNAIPIMAGVMHPGMMVVFAVCVFGFVVCMWYDTVNGFFNITKLRKRVYMWLKVLCCIGVAGFTAMSVIMIVPNFSAPVKGATVVVPGAQVRGETVSLMLSRRLDAAAQYLNDNPESMCVVSGGKGSNEQYAEAVVMKKYLIDRHGISEDRIFIEDKSRNTEQNFAFSAKVIKDNDLNEKVVITTDYFHEYRCIYEAKQNGLYACAEPCSTDWYMLPGYWVREMMAIVKAWLL